LVKIITIEVNMAKSTNEFFFMAKPIMKKLIPAKINTDEVIMAKIKMVKKYWQN